MGDPFRGDEEAALIRAAKLQEENEQLRRELEEARHPKPPPVQEPTLQPKRIRTAALVVTSLACLLGTVAGFIAVVQLPPVHPVIAPTVVVSGVVPVPQEAPKPPPDWTTEQDLTGTDLFDTSQGHEPQVGYAVGAGGTILRYYASPPGPWTRETSNTTSDLFGVAQALMGRACAVGASGTAVVLEGSSKPWKAERAGTLTDLLAVTDDASDFVAVGRHGTIRRRTDGAWVNEPSGTTADLFAIDGDYAVGAKGTILHNHQGRWSLVKSGTSEDLFGVSAAEHEDEAVIVGAHGTILRLGDPRDGFRVEASGTDADLRSVTKGYAGYDYIAVGDHGTIRHSMAAGKPWSAETSGTDHDLLAVRGFIPTMYITGRGGIVLSHPYGYR